MRVIFAILFFFSGPVALMAGAAPGDSIPAWPGGFVWGVNGHPLTQEAYFGNIDRQIALIRGMGMSYYRCDMSHDGRGVIRDSVKLRYFYELVRQAGASGISIIPLLFPPPPTVLYALPDTVAAYEQGFTLGRGFAEQYGRYFHLYELGNENDNDLITPGTDGAERYQYDTVKLNLLAAWLNGMSDGLRKLVPDARIIVSNGGWKHYAYYRLLEEKGVKFDIIGYHWYDGGRADLRGVLSVLKTQFAGKTVWFTEVNRRGGNAGSADRAQKRKVNLYLRMMRKAGKNIKGAFIYELFDQPGLEGANERQYGIFPVGRGPEEIKEKPLGRVIRSCIRRRSWFYSIFCT